MVEAMLIGLAVLLVLTAWRMRRLEMRVAAVETSVVEGLKEIVRLADGYLDGAGGQDTNVLTLEELIDRLNATPRD